MEYAQLTLHFKNKAIASLTGYWGYPGPFTTQFEISGNQGIIRFDSNQVQSLDIKLVNAEAGEGAAVQVPSSPSLYDPYYYEVRILSSASGTAASRSSVSRMLVMPLKSLRQRSNRLRLDSPR